ncbi:MAG TPA: HEAT repeat domain-containing protein [Chloroflexia bacterium]|nr:HEAT repeat domain-containing protein [Chloroflexia bacterium]
MDGAQPDPQIVAQALNDQGETALRAGDLAAASAVLEEAIPQWRALAAPTGLAEALHNLAVAYARRQEPARAVPLLQEAIGLLQAAGNAAREATARTALGGVRADLGDYPAARAELEAALPLRRAAGDWRGEAFTLEQLARLAARQHEHLQAVDYRRQALAARHRGDDPAATAQALLDLGQALAVTGQDADAFRAYEQAIALYETLGDPGALGRALLALGQARFEAGDPAGAAGPITRALPLLREAGAWDATAARWEQMVFAQQVYAQTEDVVRDLRRGRIDAVDSLRAAVQGQLGKAEAPVDQVLRALANSLQMLGTATPPAAPGASPPTAATLAAQDMRSVEELITALQDKDFGARRVAALALGLRRDPRALDALIAATRDRSQWVRQAAVQALGQLRDARALPALRARLDDPARDVRRSVATALGKIRDPQAADALTLALADPWWRVVESAEKGLRTLKATPRVAVLIDLLGQRDEHRQWVAAHRLGELGDAQARDPLLRVAEDTAQPPLVRGEALKALARLGDTRAVPVALRVIQEAGGGVSAGMPPAAPTMLHVQAIEVVGALGDATATPVLVGQLDDGNAYVRYAAVQALGAAGTPESIPALERIQQTDPATVVVDSTGRRQARLRSAAAMTLAAIRARYPG